MTELTVGCKSSSQGCDTIEGGGGRHIYSESMTHEQERHHTLGKRMRLISAAHRQHPILYTVLTISVLSCR